jgi:hypothetical protein
MGKCPQDMSNTAERRFKTLRCTLITVKSTWKGDSYTAAFCPGKTYAVSAPIFMRLLAPKPVFVNGSTGSSGSNVRNIVHAVLLQHALFSPLFCRKFFPLYFVWYEALSTTVTDCGDRLEENKLCLINVFKASTSISSGAIS